MENTQLKILDCLRTDFKKWADSNEPSTWEINVNEIGGQLSAFSRVDEPVILLDCTESEGDWFLCVNTNDINNNDCYPIKDLSDETIYEIRKCVESWLVRKDMGNLYI